MLFPTSHHEAPDRRARPDVSRLTARHRFPGETLQQIYQRIDEDLGEL